MSDGGRVYAGRSDAERRADRRARLVEAGFQLFGTVGWSGASIERLCQVASVATRSFYEEFGTREDLLRAVYERTVAEAATACLAAVEQAPRELTARTLAGVGTYVRFLTEDPRRAQVVSSEARTALMRSARSAALLAFADLIQDQTRGLAGRDDPDRGRVRALALAGAVSEVLSDWVVQAPPRRPVEPIIDELAHLFVAALTPSEE